MFTENRIGAFRKIVGVAVADRTWGGDFAFGKIVDSTELKTWGYNQVEFDRADLTARSIVFPSSSVVRITGIGMTFNAEKSLIGKGVPLFPTQLIKNGVGSYYDENLNHFGLGIPKPVFPSIYLCDKAGNTVIDVDLPIGSLDEPDNNLNILYDTTYNNEIKLFGNGRIAGIQELTGYLQLMVFVSVNFEVLSTTNADNARMVC